MTSDNEYIGSFISFVYHGGSNYGGYRYVKVVEVDVGFIKGIDLIENKFKQYSRYNISSLRIFAQPHQEIHPVEDVHPQWESMTENQIANIFSIIHPDKKNVKYSDDIPFVVCDGKAHATEWNVSEKKIYFKMNDGKEFAIPMGQLLPNEVSGLKTFLQNYS